MLSAKELDLHFIVLVLRQTLLALLTKVSNPTLIITGTADNRIPPANSLIIASKIPGAWLVHIKDASHVVMDQYPDKFNIVLQTFLSTTN